MNHENAVQKRAQGLVDRLSAQDKRDKHTNAQQARADANEAVRRAAPKDFPRWISALALATAGDSKGAAKLVEELDKSLPLDTSQPSV